MKTFAVILGAIGVLSLVAVGWSAAPPSAALENAETITSAAACQTIRAAGLCELDLGGKCTPDECPAAEGGKNAQCDPAKCPGRGREGCDPNKCAGHGPESCNPAKCPGHGPEGCNPANCHHDKQADSVGQPAHCDPTQCNPAKCQCHGPDGCDPSRCPGHGPEGCNPAKCPGHAAADSPVESENPVSKDAAPPVRVRHGGCARGCRGHDTSHS